MKGACFVDFKMVDKRNATKVCGGCGRADACRASIAICNLAASLYHTSALHHRQDCTQLAHVCMHANASSECVPVFQYTKVANYWMMQGIIVLCAQGRVRIVRDRSSIQKQTHLIPGQTRKSAMR